MNYQKLDASIISAVEASEGPADSRLSVFVSVSETATPQELASIAEIVGQNRGGERVLTASLDRSQVAALSDCSAVRLISLAQQYKALD